MASPAADGDAADGGFPWQLGIYDAHCHPTDTMASIAQLPAMRAAGLVVMSTRAQDQALVAELAAGRAPGPGLVVPAFGWHPWFSHQLYDDGPAALPPTFQPPPSDAGPDALRAAKAAHYRAVLAPAPDDAALIDSLPVPIACSAVVAAARARLRHHPCALVGEVGLDKAFRLPEPWTPAGPVPDPHLTPGSRQGRRLTPYRVRLAHQQAVLRAQLDLAAAEGRPVSLHGVQAHGLLFEALAADAPAPPRLCLHSFSGDVQLLRRWLRPSFPSKVFVSLSAAVNLSSDSCRAKASHLMRLIPDDRILVESDLHTAGPALDAALELMYRTVCRAKAWDLDEGVKKIGRNFEDFIFGFRSAPESPSPLQS